MSTGEPLPSRAVIVAVTCLCVAAACSLMNLAASFFGLIRGSTVTVAGELFFAQQSMYLIMAAAATLATVAGLLVIHRARRTGWPWLLVGGTTLTAAVVLPDFNSASPSPYLDSEIFFAAIGAGPVLVLLGMLGAGSWLLHVAGGTGAAIVGAAAAAPLLGTMVLADFLRPPLDLTVLRTLHVVLAVVSIAAAIGACALVPALRRLPEPDRPAWVVTGSGVAAGILLVVPSLVLYLGWDRLGSAAIGRRRSDRPVSAELR